ncbi:MAG: methylated-DNA--[protein]-cysteine S-methyltransferase [Candidatus Eiseniibacteriota bacterium]
MNLSAGSTTAVVRVAVATTLGGFIVEAGARGVRAVTPVRSRAIDSMSDRRAAGGPDSEDRRAHEHARAAAEALRRYASGRRTGYDGRLDVEAPAFELAVWERLRGIPFGVTTSYGELAAALGLPGEARAVGAAVGANRVCVLVPCHRVVGADGSLRGFAWGLELKRRLLAHEGSAALSLFPEAMPE